MSYAASLTVQVPLSIRRRPGRKTVVTPEGIATTTARKPATQTHGDPALVKALARAFRYQRMLDGGHYASITEMAEAEKLDRGYMGRLLQLTLLAPHLVEASLDGSQPLGLTLPRLMEPFPTVWTDHRALMTQAKGPHWHRVGILHRRHLPAGLGKAAADGLLS